MKRFLLAFSLVTVLSFNQNNNIIEAQGVNINVNIGNQPAWGPVGYDYAAYYYLPDIEVYYDINRSYFYYWDRGAWRSARYLPYSYGQYDLYGMYKVVINQPDPWRYHDNYRREYGRYRGNRSQIIILNSPDRRYDRVRYNRVDWINPNRPGRYPNYHDKHPGYGRPNNNRPNYNGGGNNNGRPDNNNRPKPNDKYSGNNNTWGSNNGRPDSNNNRPKPNDKYSGNNDRPSQNGGGDNNGRPNSRPNSSPRNDQSSTPSRSSKSQSVRSSGRSTSVNDTSNSSENNGRASNAGRRSKQ